MDVSSTNNDPVSQNNDSATTSGEATTAVVEPLDGNPLDKHPLTMTTTTTFDTMGQCFHTYIGHRFQVRDGDMLVEQFTIEHVLVKAFGESPPSGTSIGRSFEKEMNGIGTMR
jgi:hypothetical protein